MARKNRPRKSPNAAIVLGVALLFLIPLTVLLFAAQTDTFRVSLVDHNRADLEIQQIQRDTLKSQLIQVYDWAGYITNDQGNVTDVEFTIKAPEGYKAMDLRGIEIYLPMCNMILGFPDVNNAHGKFVVLQDLQGWVKQNRFGPGTTLRISFSGLNITPGEDAMLRITYHSAGDLNSFPDDTEVEKIFPPVFASEASKPSNPYFIPVILRDGKYPEINGSWIVNNSTIIENKTVLVNSDIIVQPGGTLLLRNSSLVFNSTKELQYNLTVVQGGNIDMQNSSITATNTTIVDNIIAGYGLFILGNATVEGSLIQYFNEIEILSNGISIERTVIGAPRDKENATAWNGYVRIRGANPKIKDSFFNSDLILKGTKMTSSGIGIKYHSLFIDDSVVVLEKFESVTPDWMNFGEYSFFWFSNSAVTVDNSSFIGPGSGIYSRSSMFSEESLTVTHSSFNRRGSESSYGPIIDFNGVNIIFNENNMSNVYLGLNIGERSLGGLHGFPIIATIVGNTFNNISQPVMARNTRLTVNDNKFVGDPLRFYGIYYIEDRIMARITIYSDSIIPIRPSYELKRTSDDNVLRGFGGGSCKDMEVPKSAHWCAIFFGELSDIVVRSDGVKLDQNNYEVKLSSGLWEKTVEFKLTVGFYQAKYLIEVSDGSFYPLLIIVTAFYVTITIIVISQRKFNRVFDKKGKTNYEEEGNVKHAKGTEQGTIPLPIMRDKQVNNKPHKHRQKKKRPGHL